MPTRERRASKRAAAYGYAGEHFSLEQWAALLEACGYRCLRCGTHEDLSSDHIVPLSLGGANSIDNIQPLCEPCNSAKGLAVRDYRPWPAGVLL
jgi:5-methylcytosine-specific restriction endonuclease McrA